jgi:hypothetical protein
VASTTTPGSRRPHAVTVVVFGALLVLGIVAATLLGRPGAADDTGASAGTSTSRPDAAPPDVEVGGGGHGARPGSHPRVAGRRPRW